MRDTKIWSLIVRKTK